MTYIPASHLITFVLNAERGRYVVDTCEPGFTRVPRELIVEDKRFNGDIKAKLILRGTATEKKTGGRSIKFFTGLQPTMVSDVFLGNVLTFGRDGSRIQNGVLVRFSTDAGRMAVMYFPAYYPYPEHRATFMAEVLRRRLI